jgi:hypothetical protein
VDVPDLFEQQFVLLSAQRVGPAEPVVVAGSGHVQYPTGHRDIDIKVGIVGEFTDQRED